MLTSNPSRKRYTWLIILIVFLSIFYSLAFVIFTDPLAFHFRESFINQGGDAYVFVWNIFNFKEQLIKGQNLFKTKFIFHPLGTSLIFHTYSPVYGFMGVLIGNEILTLNVVIYLSFLLSAIGAFLLCYRGVKDIPLSVMAGFIFAFCPFKLAHLCSHFNLMLTATIPFFVLLFPSALSFKDDKGWPQIQSIRIFLVLLLLFIVTFFSDYYYTLFLLIYVFLYIFYFRFRIYRFNPFKTFNIILIISIILGCTFAWKLLDVLNLSNKGALDWSPDFLAFFIRSPYHRFVNYFECMSVRMKFLGGHPYENTIFLGWFLFILVAGYIIFRCWRKESPDRKIYIFLTICYLVLAMPILRVWKRPLCAFPTVFLHYIPFVNNFRVPSRYCVMVMLFLPILGCLFLKKIIYPKISRIMQIILPFFLIVALTMEYIQNPYSTMHRSNVPKVYKILRGKKEGALLELPFGLRDGFRMVGQEKTIQMFYQITHCKNILGGLNSRIDGSIFRYFDEDPVASVLLRMQMYKIKGEELPNLQQVKDFTRKFNVSYVLIHPGFQNIEFAPDVINLFTDCAMNKETIDSYILITLLK